MRKVTVNWEKAYADFCQSGLRVSEYIRCRLIHFCADGRLPDASYVYRRFRTEKARVTEISSGSCEVPNVATPNEVAIYSLCNEVSTPPSIPRKTSAHKTRSTPVRLTLPGGALLEFETAMPEQLAVQLLCLTSERAYGDRS